MTDREKLIELLKHDNCPLFMVFGDSIEVLADHLIANGVTVLTEDEARNVYTVQEIEALQGEAYDLGVDSVLHHKFGLSWDDAAELRKEVSRLQAATKWIAVTERLPEKDGHYICNYHFGEYPKMTFTQVLDYYATDIVPHFQHTLGDGSMKVTHWTPLPEPPEEGE